MYDLKFLKSRNEGSWWLFKENSFQLKVQTAAQKQDKNTPNE